MTDYDELAAAIACNDRMILDRGLDIWVGSEPTFTQRFSTDPEWTTQALGSHKLQCADDLARVLHRAFPGSMVIRSVGRQYPGERFPRWSIGLYRRRDGSPVWAGPPDPVLLDGAAGVQLDLEEISTALLEALSEVGARVWKLPRTEVAEQRLILTWGGSGTPDLSDPRMQRPSVHERPIPDSGLQDELAREGIWLLVLREMAEADRNTGVLELPAFSDTATFLKVLAAIGPAAERAGLRSLVLRGFPPPVDRTVEWATITPDPAVIEINMAPDSSALAFLERSRSVYEAAEMLGLSPYRLYFNGAVADSGGGGQITLGGSSPGTSPFLRHPQLLPRLIRYCNRHPCLSYLFAHDSIGGSGQSVRPDERGNEAFRELGLALDLLGRETDVDPEVIWRSLGPFMTDPSGNAHRAELNIEKLWNPFLPGRGQLGLVEFRAFRMQHTPERAASLVCLLRSILAMLSDRDFAPPLKEWGSELHERFALPFYLEQDLREIFGDLKTGGLALDHSIRKTLLQDEFRDLAWSELDACRVRVRRALEFWPLVGDTSSQERGTSRLVDSSTQRLEVCLYPLTGEQKTFPRLRAWVEGIEIPFRDEVANGEPVKVFGIRQRSFVPWLGLHPTLQARPTIQFAFQASGSCVFDELVWHDWRPGGGAYEGMPCDLNDARQRRAERLSVRRGLSSLPFPESGAPAGSLTPWSLDLRWAQRREAAG